MVTGWSYLVASSGVPASWSSCTSALPLEVTRMEMWRGLPSDISGISATVAEPSHSPARDFMVAKAFCASDGAGAVEDMCGSGFCVCDWAKATVESAIKATESIERRECMVEPPWESLGESIQCYS